MARRFASGAATAVALVLAAQISLAGPARAQDQQDSRYRTWNAGGTGTTKDMVKELRALVDEAEKARAADPRFLDDLKALANAFDDTKPVEVLTDDFRDGDYTKGVAWTVTRGRWWVESAVGLRAVVAAPAASPAAGDTQQGTSTTKRGTDDLAAAILSDLLGQMSKKPGDTQAQQQPQQQQQAGTDTQPAAIEVARPVPNAFQARFEITSRARYGEFRAAMYQSSVADGWGYQLVYAPGAAQGLRLLRASRGQYSVVGFHDGKLDLEDGRLHVIEWTRGLDGAMTVALDGKTLIQATDVRLRDPFDGLSFVNLGGDYALRAVSVKRAR